MKKSESASLDNKNSRKGFLVSSHTLLILVMTLFSFQMAEAKRGSYLNYGEHFNDYLRSGLGFRSLECEDALDRSVNKGNLQQSLKKAQKKTRACAKVETYLGIINTHQDIVKARVEDCRPSKNPIVKKAHRELIDAYAKGRDVIGTMNAANCYLKAYGQDYEVRLKMLRLARKNFAKNPGFDHRWERMVLGIDELQHPRYRKKHFNNFMVQNFLRTFSKIPKKVVKEMMDIYDLAGSNIKQKLLDVAKQRRRQKEYKAMIIVLRPEWAEGADSAIFGEVMYMSIEAFLKLAQQIRQVQTKGKVPWSPGIRRIDAKRISSLLSPNEKVDYEKEYHFMIEQAELLLEYMMDEAPRSQWTLKAQKFFK